MTAKTPQWFGLLCARCGEPFRARAMTVRLGLCCRIFPDYDEQPFAEVSGT